MATIMIVEDNAIQREGMAAVLRDEGHTVLTAANGDEGLSWVRCEPSPDLILLDMMIRQGHDGWYFFAKRKQIPSALSIPVVIVTGIGNASNDWATDLGASGLIRKPVETETLLAEVNRWLVKSEKTGTDPIHFPEDSPAADRLPPGTAPMA
jgi:twitching motility two-component system response regulator PilH